MPASDSLKAWYQFFLARKPFERNAEKINEAYKFEQTGAFVRGIGNYKRFQEWPEGSYYLECKSPTGEPVQSEDFVVRSRVP